jgi:hypothetical protein
MSFFHALLSQKIGDEFTNAGHQIFGIVGDSNADGRGVTIPTVSAGVLYLFNGTSFDEITTQTVANAGDYGSIWQQFATDYNSDTGYKVNIVNGASGGAEFYPNGDNNNWYTSGDLYSAFTTKLDAALTARSIQKPRAIFINCGINDVRGSISTSNIRTGVSSLVSRLKSDYPGTPILFIQIGRSETSAITENLIEARKVIVDQCESDADCYIAGSALGIIGAGQYNVDNLHYSTTGCNSIGSQVARWFKNSAYTNKWVRAIISCHFDELSTTRKNLINSKIGGIYTRGDYFKIAQYLNFVTTEENNCWVDFAFLGFGFTGFNEPPASFTANTYITTDGSSSFLTPSYINAFYNSVTGQDDFMMGIDIETFSTAGGVLSIAFGGTDGTSICYVRQTASNTVQFVANDGTPSTGSGTAIADNAFVALARNGGTQYQLTETTEVASAAVASNGQCGVLSRIGNFNNNGTLGSWWSAMNVRCFMATTYSDIDTQTIVDLLDISRDWNL